jgi:NTP pyrophosphatase (non-canonical NTP hydrolase)
MNIRELQIFVREYGIKLEERFWKYDDQEKLVLSSTVKLTEELGELCNEVMFYNSRQRSEKREVHDQENLPHEFADVMIALFMLAKDMDVNIEKALSQKIEKIKTKYNLL